jgi:type I restriction enzyme S subunit
MDVMTENNALPKLRFGESKTDWEVKVFEDIYSFYSTNSLSREKLNYIKGEVFNIHYGDIHTKFSTMFDLTKELVPLINAEVDLNKYTEDNYCQEGDLVVADASEDYGDIGKTIEIINLSNRKVLAGLHTILARPNKYRMAKGFAGYLIQSWGVRKQLMIIAQGSKVLGIAKWRLGKIKVNIPELEEQQKIASFLSSIDDKTQQLTKKRELLEQYKKGLLQQLFSQKLCFKDDNGNNFKDWEEKKLKEIGVFISGTGFSKLEQGGVEGVPFLKVSDMNLEGNEFIISNANNYVNLEQINRLKYKQINKLSIIFAKVGAAIFLERKRIASNFLIDNNMMSFTPNGDIIFFKSLFDTIRLSKFAQVGALPSYNASDLKTIKIKLPSLKEQQKIANFLSAVDNKIDLVSTQIENTKAFKKGLLQQMFV